MRDSQREYRLINKNGEWKNFESEFQKSTPKISILFEIFERDHFSSAL